MTNARQNQITLIEDNAGGMTLQLVGSNGERWQHLYWGGMGQLADDIGAFAGGSDPWVDGWEGDQSADGWLDPTQDELDSGGYRVIDFGEILNTDPEDIASAALRELREELCRVAVQAAGRK